MSKKSGVSIDFDEKQFDKDFRKALDKQLANFDKKMKCPDCKRNATFKFKNYKANCPKCGFELVLDRK
ncbi:hypothetical protein [Staphylococcus saprophyticus]|uniref:hypothetical protein n=1 Tax=Staphylococcus saprophyticus TaxID=29385 RepID=UPI00280B1290|nr:hypothetical protein [Staphylococcus saprophyticus]WMM14432.1 hypothetical protein RCG45_06530 [Staphylococcus saprophyticus]